MLKRASKIVEIVPDDHLETLRRCGGYYKCPKSPDGERLGPLVGYAGTYGEEGRHYVGDVYFNFAKAEVFPHVLNLFAITLARRFRAQSIKVDCIMAAPMGGLAFGFALACRLDRRFIFAEKKVMAVATIGSREESKLELSRHELPDGANVVLVEDVCNNFSTTAKARALIEAAGAHLIGLACELNRSPEITWEGLPVISLLHIPTEQYRQDDPKVAADIAASNVAWKPKNEWERLMTAMSSAR